MCERIFFLISRDRVYYGRGGTKSEEFIHRKLTNFKKIKKINKFFRKQIIYQHSIK